MNLAVKFYKDVPADKKAWNIPEAWPAEVRELGESTELPGPEWLLMTLEEYNAYRASEMAQYMAWEEANESWIWSEAGKPSVWFKVKTWLGF